MVGKQGVAELASDHQDLTAPADEDVTDVAGLSVATFVHYPPSPQAAATPPQRAPLWDLILAFLTSVVSSPQHDFPSPSDWTGAPPPRRASASASPANHRFRRLFHNPHSDSFPASSIVAIRAFSWRREAQTDVLLFLTVYLPALRTAHDAPVISHNLWVTIPASVIMGISAMISAGSLSGRRVTVILRDQLNLGRIILAGGALLTGCLRSKSNLA